MTDYYVDEDYDEDEFDYYDDPEAEDEADRVAPRRPRSREIEGRTSWTYLGLLLALFVTLVFFSWACDDRESPVEVQPEPADEVAEGSTPVRLSIMVDGDVATLSGSVPDEAARQQILIATQNLYGAENVIDELVVDDAMTLDGGVVAVNGSTRFNDNRPSVLRRTIVTDFGLGEGEFSIDRGSPTVDPVVVTGELTAGSIRFEGTVPEQASIDELSAAAQAIWGPKSVDVGGLRVGDSTWSEGTVTVTGAAGPGDTRHLSFPAEVQERLGALITVDISGITLDLSPAALAVVEEEIRSLLTLQPILFAPQSAEIDPVSDQVIADIATRLRELPQVNVEVVGHTDDEGPEDENLVLSEQRAEAVAVRLAELGIGSERLNTRGEGEAVPLVPNDSPENQALNRRIEFILVGPGG